MKFNECDKVMTLVDKKFDNGFVPSHTIGYIVWIEEKNGNMYYWLEIATVNTNDPLFLYETNEIVKA